MSPKEAANAFKPFFSTKSTGTGLGLAIVQGIIREHGGHIAINSVPGEGTTVAFDLPLAPSFS